LFGDLSQFDSAKSFAAYLGLSPCQHQSGTIEKKARLPNQGSTDIKSMLFNCARCAIQHNPICKAFYRKLVDTKFKAKKVALIAVMHKLARIIWGVTHSGKPFSASF
jgi:transposase